MNKRSGKDSKEKILKAALKVFSEYGYKGASIRMIANTAEISIGGVYLHFKNKEELYLTLIREKFGDLLGMVWKAIKGINDPIEAITTFIKMHIEYAKSHKELILTQGREQGFTFGIKMKKEFFEKQRSIVEQIIRKGIDSGSFGECNAREVTKIIIGAIRGFILSMVIDPDNLFSPEDCSKFMLSGLLQREEKAVNNEQLMVKSAIKRG